MLPNLGVAPLKQGQDGRMRGEDGLFHAGVNLRAAT